MGANHPYANRYKEVAIRTANPLQLVVILYDGAINALQEAQEHLRRSNISGRARCVNRSVAIISELQATLNLQAGGDIARSLDRLYDYMKRRIFKANLDQKPEPLAEVAALLANLRAAWGEIAGQSPASPAEASKPESFSTPVSAQGFSGSLNISG